MNKFTAHETTWNKHTPGDKMPVDGETEVYTLHSYGGAKCHSRKAKFFDWGKDEVDYQAQIIGWRLADEVKAGPSDNEMLDWLEANKARVACYRTGENCLVTVGRGKKFWTFFQPTLRQAITAAMRGEKG